MRFNLYIATLICISSHDLVHEAARLLQRYEPLDDRVKRDHLALRFSANVVTVAHIHRACIEFLLADDCERGAYMRISAEK